MRRRGSWAQEDLSPWPAGDEPLPSFLLPLSGGEGRSLGHCGPKVQSTSSLLFWDTGQTRLRRGSVWAAKMCGRRGCPRDKSSRAPVLLLPRLDLQPGKGEQKLIWPQQWRGTAMVQPLLPAPSSVTSTEKEAGITQAGSQGHMHARQAPCLCKATACSFIRAHGQVLFSLSALSRP